ALAPSTPPWKQAEEADEIKPSLEHFKSQKKTAPPVRERPAPPKTSPPKPSVFEGKDRLPPWKREGPSTRRRPPSLAERMRPKKPASPKAAAEKIPTAIPIRKIKTQPASPLPVAPKSPSPGIEKISRKVRKAVASRATGAQLCPKCQWVVKPGQRFCTFCGTPMTPAAAKAMAPAPSRTFSKAPTAFRPSRAPRPPVATDRGPGAPLMKSGCIVAAAVGFFMLISVFICISGSSKKTKRISHRPAKVKLSDWKNTAPARDRSRSRPGIDGPKVTLHLKNGRQITGNLLAATNTIYRVKSGNQILRVKKSAVQRFVYHP
ncbi:MAG: zinc ribbon domain-containing protein, partial [Planctomycetota bacterium]